MKKLFLIVAVSFVFLMVSSFVCYLLKFITFNAAWVPLVIGSAIIVPSLMLLFPYYKLGKVRYLNYILVLNMISMGFLIKSWHLFRGYQLQFWVLALVSLACVIYLLIYYFLSFVPLFSKHYTVYLIIMVILSLAGYIALIATTKTTFISTYGYYMIIELGFVLALSSDTKSKADVLGSITLSTFTIIIVAVIIAAFMLGGDVDFDFSSGGFFELKSPKEQLRRKDGF